MRWFRKPSKGFIIAISGAFLSGCAIVNLRYLLQDGQNPLNITAWISLFMVVPWFFVFFKRTGEYQRLSLKNKLILVFIGISSSVGFNYLQSLAIANTSAINFAFLFRTIVVFTIIFAWFFFKEKITWTKILLVTGIIIGSYFLTTGGKLITPSKGDIYTLLMSAATALIANILVKHTVAKMHPDVSGAVSSFVTALTLVIAAYVAGVFTIPHNVGYVVLGSLITFSQVLLRNRGYTMYSASFATMMYSLAPFFVTILSIVLLHEQISLVELLGGCIIVGSILLVEKFKI